MRGVDLALERGELLLVLGSNGAGKTTLLRMLAGLVRPTAGVVTVDGAPLLDNPGLRRSIGLISHQTLLYDDLTAEENLRFAAGLYGLADPAGTARAALERVALSDRAGEPVRSLSRGMVQRVAIARALLHSPSIILLDEPFTGLDHASAEQVRAVLQVQREAGAAIVVVTHNPSEAWDLASHVGVLVRGAWAILEPRPGALAEFQPRFAEAVRA